MLVHMQAQIDKGAMKLEELTLEDLKRVCTFLMPAWNMGRRHKTGFPALPDAENSLKSRQLQMKRSCEP